MLNFNTIDLISVFDPYLKCLILDYEIPLDG